MRIFDSKDFGVAINKRRKELGLTQKYISDFTGCSVSFISDLENGKATAELGKALMIANILGLTIEVNERE